MADTISDVSLQVTGIDELDTTLVTLEESQPSMPAKMHSQLILAREASRAETALKGVLHKVVFDV